MIVAVGEEGELGLIFIPGEGDVLALALGEGGGRAGIAGLNGEHTGLGGVDKLLAVVGEGELDDIGDGALGAIGERTDDEIGAGFGAHAASAASSGAATAAAGLLIAFLLGGCVGAAASTGRDIGAIFPIGENARGFFGHREALHAIDPGDFARGEIDDGHAVAGRGLLVLLRLVALSLCGEGGEYDRLAIGGELDGDSARFGGRPFFRSGVRYGRGTRARGLALLLAGDQIANDDLAIAFLREESVRQKFSVVGEALAGDGFPGVVVVVVQGALRLGDQQSCGRKREEDTAGVKHILGIVVHSRLRRGGRPGGLRYWDRISSMSIVIVT